MDTQEYWVHAMEAATGSLGHADRHTSRDTTTRPTLSDAGMYTVLEEIRNDRQYSRGMGFTRVPSPHTTDTVDLRTTPSSPNGVEQTEET